MQDKAFSSVIDQDIQLEVIDNLSGFRDMTTFQRTMFSVLVNFQANSADISMLMGVFKQIDLDNDGVLQKHEIEQFIT